MSDEPELSHLAKTLILATDEPELIHNVALIAVILARAPEFANVTLDRVAALAVKLATAAREDD